MSAALKLDVKPDAAIKAIEDNFQDRCKARAMLVAACEMNMQEAVDGLQEDAAASGLLEAIGQDDVQSMMAVFGLVPRAGQLEADFKVIADQIEIY